MAEGRNQSHELVVGVRKELDIAQHRAEGHALEVVDVGRAAAKVDSSVHTGGVQKPVGNCNETDLQQRTTG